MTPQRWRQVEDLYHAALVREPAARAEFLANADSELRSEVESLLAQTDATTALITQTGPLMPGAQLGPYRIEAAIGAGGMGEVYRATDTRLHRTVAIKTLPHDRVADPERKRRFIQEARAASALNHPNIVTVHDIANDSGIDYLVMEYVTGKSLDKLIASGGMPLALVVDYATQITSALATAHAAGIVHRDIKPANVMVTAEGHIKVLDFGLAKLGVIKSGPEEETRTIAPALTVAGNVMGTIAYMSPEQARGEEVDGRTDLFSFGAMLYELVSGRRAFPKALDWTMPPIDVLPAELRPIVLKLLENNRDLRYRHASEVRTDLQRLKRDSDTGASAMRPGPSKRRWAIAAAAVVVLLIGAGYTFLRGAPKLTDKDMIVLADFKNTTGDPVFDETLRQGLSVQLEQSPFLSLIPDERIRKTLGLMGLPADTLLTLKTGKEICERTDAAAVLTGSIASLDSQYVIGLNAENCRTGVTLDAEQITASGKEAVLGALSKIATTFRSRVGESLSTVRNYSTPLAEATTSSLEALKAYSTAMKVDYVSGDSDAIPLFRRAIELDNKFAMAYADLGLAYSSVGESVLSAANTTKAWQLRDHVSERERFFIDAMYDRQVTGSLDRERETLKTWVQTYPRDRDAHGLLSGFASKGTGAYEEGIGEAGKAMEIDPSAVFPYINIATANIYLDRPAEAGKEIAQALAHNLDAPDFLVLRYYLAFFKDDQTEMGRQVALAKGKSDTEDWIAHAQSLVLARAGRLRQARTMSLHAVDLATHAGKRERAATYESAVAVWEAFYGNIPEARRSATAASELSKGRDVQYAVALAFAGAGESAHAQTLADDMEKRFPEDTSVQLNYLPVLHAALALQHEQPQRAVEILQTAAAHELAVPGITYLLGCFGGLYPAYVRGEAYLATHQYAEAAVEFRKLLDHRGIVAADPAGAMARLQLGRVLALSGDKAGAKAAYADLLTVWKDADPNMLLARKAREESSRL